MGFRAEAEAAEVEAAAGSARAGHVPKSHLVLRERTWHPETHELGRRGQGEALRPSTCVPSSDRHVEPLT